jgi:hypothetical protein
MESSLTTIKRSSHFAALNRRFQFTAVDWIRHFVFIKTLQQLMISLAILNRDVV